MDLGNPLVTDCEVVWMMLDIDTLTAKKKVTAICCSICELKKLGSHFLWFRWWRAVHRKWIWYTFPLKKKQIICSCYATNTTVPAGCVQKLLTLTSPSPGLILVMGTSSKQVMWVFKGSEVILMVESQMPVKTRALSKQKDQCLWY